MKFETKQEPKNHSVWIKGPILPPGWNQKIHNLRKARLLRNIAFLAPEFNPGSKVNNNLPTEPLPRSRIKENGVALRSNGLVRPLPPLVVAPRVIDEIFVEVCMNWIIWKGRHAAKAPIITVYGTRYASASRLLYVGCLHRKFDHRCGCQHDLRHCNVNLRIVCCTV